MTEWVVGSAVRFGRLVVAAAIGVLGVGLFQLAGATVDVYPEFEPPAVQVQAEALGLSAQEVEQLITVPLEQDLLNGIPWLSHIRSKSMPGLSSIDLDFEPGTDLYEARQMVQERMTQAKALPNVGTPPIMVQPTASTSRVAMIALTSKTVSTMQMSVLARWQIRPRLMSIPGVANVSVWGQRDRQLQVRVDPDRLRASKVTLTELIESTGNALWVSPLSFVEASTPGTGGFVETPNQRLGVQHVQPITTSRQLADVSVEGDRKPPLRIGDVATVLEDHQPLIGDASASGAPGLMLVVERFPDADTAQVTRDVEAAMDAMAPGLSGITIDAKVFRPADYLATALRHLGVAGLLGLVLLLAALATLLLSWRVALIAAVSVPLSLTAAAYVLHLRGQTLTTMTLIGLAAALPVIVDDAVGDVSEISRRLRAGPAAGQRRAESVMVEVVKARRGMLLCGVAVVLLLLSPILATSEVTRSFATPVVVSYTLAVLASFVVALVVTPAMTALLLTGHEDGVRAGSMQAPVHRLFDRFVAPLLGRPLRGLVAAAVLAVVGVATATLSASGQALPTLQDRNVLVRLQAAPGTALNEMNRITERAAAELRTVAGVRSTGAHVGRAIGSDQVVDVDSAEIWVEVTQDADYSRTLDTIRSTMRGYPGLDSVVRTYAQDRVSTVAASTGDGLVVRVYGNDLTTLRETGDDVAEVLGTISGILSPRVQAQVSEPTIEIEVDLAAAQRHGLRPGDVRREASTLISGLTVGSLYEQQKVFDVVVWGGHAGRESLASLQSLLIDTPSGGHVRIGDVARVRLAPDPVAISHDAVSRSIDVTASVSDRGAADVSQEVTERLRGMAMPYEYRAEVMGGAVERQDDLRRMALLSLVVAGLVFLVLQAATGTWRGAAVLFGTLPLAVVGVVLVGPLVGGLRSVGVVAALVAVLALAVRQALVLVRRAQHLGERPGQVGGPAAVRAVAREMAPAVVGTALVTAAVLMPPAFMGDVPGLEVLHPFAVAALAGLVTSVIAVLVLVPTFLVAVATTSHRRRTASGATEQTEVSP
jgi:Cu/Ag efflux pump CusA